MEANGVPPKPSSPPDNSDREVLVITSTSGGGHSIDHSESVVLDSSSRVRRIDIMKNAPIGGFALAYCAHRLYRRYCPRRLPVFTPFKLTELYFFWGSALTLSCYAFVSFADIIRDRDLLTIYLGGDAVAHMTAKQREEISSSSDQILFRGTRGVTFRSALESIRVGLYDTYTPFQKLNWWHHHARHDRRTWDAWAGAVVATDVKLNQRASGEVPDPLAISDLDICATHLADYSSLEQYTQMDNRLSIAFGMSIPFAMLARRTGLRMLYLPMNGLQRILLAAILYQSFVVLHSRFENIKKIKDKGRYAAIVTAMFHNSSFDKAIEEHRRIVPPELDSLFRDD